MKCTSISSCNDIFNSVNHTLNHAYAGKPQPRLCREASTTPVQGSLNHAYAGKPQPRLCREASTTPVQGSLNHAYAGKQEL